MHSNLERRARRSNKVKVWILIVLIVFGCFLVLYFAVLRRDLREVQETSQTLQPTDGAFEPKDGRDLPEGLKAVFDQFKHLIGSSQIDTEQNTYVISNIYLNSRPNFV